MGVRIPVSVETAKARRRERLVDGRVSVYPRIALTHGARVGGQLFREGAVKKTGRTRAAAVMNKADDGAHSQLFEAREALVGPGPVCFFYSIGRSPLP